MAPRDVATALAGRLGTIDGVKAVDVAGPGFLNITLDAASAGELARAIVEAGRAFGRNDSEAGHVINVEFISGNPTGDLHIGHTRWAALGDALARLLRASGAEVSTEYYINDAGAQMDKFGASIVARLRGEEVPEGGYPGEYVDRAAAARCSSNAPTCSTCPPTRRRRGARPRVPAAARGRSGAPWRASGCTSTSGSPSSSCTTPGSRAGGGAAARAGPRLRPGRRGLAADHRLHRRQGPRARPGQRRAHVLRRRRRLLPQQEGPRVPREDLPPRRRPPRLRQPAQGHRRLRGRRPRAATSRCSSGSS